MGRPRLTIGTFGDIGYQRAAGGRVVARARYRDWDGKARLVQATGETRKAAERALKAKTMQKTEATAEVVKACEELAAGGRA